MSKTIALLLAASCCSVALAQPQQDARTPIRQEVQHNVLSKLTDVIVSSYVDKKQAVRLARELEQMIKQVDTNKQLSPNDFAELVTQELQKVSGDQHLRVDYSEERIDIPTSQGVVEGFQNNQERDLWRARNLGFEKVERLPFNIGYLQLSAFAPVSEAKRMLAASFEFLKNTDSLIIDLRGNFGGFEYTDQLFASYFLEKKTHLFDMHFRKADKVEPRWSQLEVDGPKYGSQRPVYILTDNRTFSAGEAFSYMMKHLGRATIVGETTGGAAHAGEDVQLSNHFSAFIPTRRPINPITKTNFEGVGVVPQVTTKAEDALNVAQVSYLNSLKKREQDDRRAMRIDRRIYQLTTKEEKK